MMWNAVVLAGDRNPNDPVARAGLTPFKAMAPVGARRLIDFPLAALSAMMDEGRIGRIMVVATPGMPDPDAGNWDVIEAGETIADSLARVYAAVGAPLLVTTCDAAMLTPDILTEFLNRAEDGQELSAAITPLSVAEVTPEAPPRKGFAFGEDSFVGANLFAIATTSPEPAFAALERAERRRRLPADALLAALSWRLRPPTIEQVEAKAEKLLGCSARLITLTQPEAGFEVNTALDLMHLRQRWAAFLTSDEEVDADPDEEEAA